MKELLEILAKLGLKYRKEYDLFNRLIYVIYYDNPETSGIYTVVKGSCKEVKKFVKRKYEKELLC